MQRGSVVVSTTTATALASFTKPKAHTNDTTVQESRTVCPRDETSKEEEDRNRCGGLVRWID
ncbi:hypothetical protein CP533_4175 [Ophiocordyceps camponoti-saundersi (nom. inval.)]|nr:hypothetical protein CP533_4175 [Ophiocordyceps camponoti-saundersi (nom. inval.)]